MDKTLRQLIEERLAQDNHLSAFNIQIEVLKGVVTLRGVVPTARAKLAVHELAQSAPGCLEVFNELRIQPAAGATDAAIADAVRHALDKHPEIAKGAIAVQVDGGLVALSGAVATQEEYETAEEVARAIRGVRDVLNMLIIDRDAQDEDESLRIEIQAAVDAVPALRGSDIRVSVSGDLIVLSGHVHRWREKDLAAEAALRIRPWRLHNDITVSQATSTK